ncbi:MAG: tripartite tricarboxylate transporter substrate-binding protein, partial [Variovorax sp.]
MQRRTFIHTALASAAASLAVLPAFAQNQWPTAKAITYVVPFPAGGTTDVLGRLISQKLGSALGTSVVIDNKGGAGGSVGSEIASRAAPDGYTMLGGTISSHAINVSLYPKIGYDPLKSFAPVTLIGTNPVVLVVNQASPHKTL